MSYTQKIAVLVLYLALVGIAKSTYSAHSVSERAQLNDSNSNILVQPTMYQVFPLDTSQSGPAVSELTVQRTGNVSTIENIAVFEGIPDFASVCVLGWIQAARGDRDFTVRGNGLLSAQQLSQIPDGDVSWENIVPIANEAVQRGLPLLHPDTSDWADVDTAASHIAGDVDCHPTIYLKLQVDRADGDGYVYLGQDAQNGLTLEFH